jgi:hypothetical protein
MFMERRHFLKIAVGVAAGAVALAVSAEAAPLVPQALTHSGALSPTTSEAHPAVVTGTEVNELKPEQVRWRHGWGHRHWGWRHRHWGWRHRHWRRRYW